MEIHYRQLLGKLPMKNVYSYFCLFVDSVVVWERGTNSPAIGCGEGPVTAGKEKRGIFEWFLGRSGGDAFFLFFCRSGVGARAEHSPIIESRR